MPSMTETVYVPAVIGMAVAQVFCARTAQTPRPIATRRRDFFMLSGFRLLIIPKIGFKLEEDSSMTFTDTINLFPKLLTVALEHSSWRNSFSSSALSRLFPIEQQDVQLAE